MTTRPHAFVAMPFGIEPGADGHAIDFNRVYAEYIAPALALAGLEPFRADAASRAGDICTDMFQELLIADLVIADLTIDDPNVWYQLGVRHALRARGVVLVSGGSVTTAFDRYTDRKLRYGIKDGGPDPATLEDDKRKLADMVEATMESWRGSKVSPVYDLIPNLREPDWRSLRIGAVRAFWTQHDDWQNRVDLACAAGRVGDVLVLAEEAPVAAFRAAAWIKAGAALRQAGSFRFALEQLDRGLEIEPESIQALREKGMCLQRLAAAGVPGRSLDQARAHYREMLKRRPADAETWALLGRVDQDVWVAGWRRPGSSLQQIRDDATATEGLLHAAIDSYSRGFRADPRHYDAGIDALTLMHLARDLTGDARYDRDIAISVGAVRFAAECASDDRQCYGSSATLGELEVLVGTAASVKAAYGQAIANNAGDWFALSASRQRLKILQDIGFRPETVAAGLLAFDHALARRDRPESRSLPRQVLVFSGHMIDAPDRTTPRFPAAKEAVAAQAIAETLDKLGAGPQDRAFSQAAAGGDLLFIEACQERGVPCQVLLALAEPEFIDSSVLPSSDGPKWRDRFYAAKARLRDPIRIMPEELGPLPKGSDPFERCNLWLLYSALACGGEKVRFVALWNGSGGDGPGGTAHMYDEVKRRTGRVTWLDTRKL